MNKELLRVEKLKKYFPVTKGLVLMKTVGYVQAVDGIDFAITRLNSGFGLPRLHTMSDNANATC